MSDFTYEVKVVDTRINEDRYFLPFWTKAYVDGQEQKVKAPAGIYKVKLRSSKGIYYVDKVPGYQTQYPGQLFPVLGLLESDTRKRPGIPMPWNVKGWLFWVLLILALYLFKPFKKIK